MSVTHPVPSARNSISNTPDATNSPVSIWVQKIDRLRLPNLGRPWRITSFKSTLRPASSRMRLAPRAISGSLSLLSLVVLSGHDPSFPVIDAMLDYVRL